MRWIEKFVRTKIFVYNLCIYVEDGYSFVLAVKILSVAGTNENKNMFPGLHHLQYL